MASLERAYIISWFGNPEIKERRKEIHRQQVDWFLARGLKVLIFAQEYLPDDYLNIPGVEYITWPDSVIPPGHARNHLFKEFYRSNEDIAIFADNDAVIYDKPQHMVGHTFIEDINAGMFELYEHVDVATPVNPVWEPFGAKFKKNLEQYQNNHAFVASKQMRYKGSLFILKNLKKHHGKEYFYDMRYGKMESGGILPQEEGELYMQMVRDGLGAYKFDNLILKEWSPSGEHSTWQPDMSARSEHYQIIYEILAEKYGHDLVSVNHEKKSTQVGKFFEKYFQKPMRLWLPRPGVKTDSEFFEF